MLLHYGDVVMLSCQLTSVDRLHAGLEEDNGFVFSAATSERRADDSVFLGVPQQSASATSASEQVRPPQNLRECRFVVFPKLLYMAQRDLLLCKNTTNSTSPLTPLPWSRCVYSPTPRPLCLTISIIAVRVRSDF